MKALEILIDSISDSTKKTIILWGNLYKGTVSIQNNPTIEDLINIIEPPKSFTDEVKVQVNLMFGVCKDRESFIQRSKDLLEGHSNYYSTEKEQLLFTANRIVLSDYTIEIINLNVQHSPVGKELFKIKKLIDPKDYKYKVRKLVGNKYKYLRDPVSHEESLKPIYDQSWVRTIDSNSTVTNCYSFNLEPLINDLVCCIYKKSVIETINKLVDDSMISGDYDNRPLFINPPTAIRYILEISGEKKWESLELRHEVDTKFKRLGPKANFDIFKTDFNNAVSRLAKEYPNRIDVDDSKRRNFKRT
jgi:hypothetical protein